MRDNYQCQYSKRYGKIKEAQMVHHIFPRSEYPEYALSDWNLISLTYESHNKMHDDTGGLSEEGRKLLRRTAMRYNIPIPSRYM